MCRELRERRGPCGEARVEVSFSRGQAMESNCLAGAEAGDQGGEGRNPSGLVGISPDLSQSVGIFVALWAESEL